MFFCIVVFVGDGLVTHIDWLNITGSNLKLYLGRFKFLNIFVWFYIWSNQLTTVMSS